MFILNAYTELLLQNGWKRAGKTRAIEAKSVERQRFKLPKTDKWVSIGSRIICFYRKGKNGGGPHDMQKLRTIRDALAVSERIEGKAWKVCDGHVWVKGIGGMAVREEDEHGKLFYNVQCQVCKRTGRIYGQMTRRAAKSWHGHKNKICRDMADG